MGGRLSKEEIERMVNDADKYREEDEKQRERVSSKNALESYCFNMKQTIEDEKVKDKIPESDRQAVTDKCSETISWLVPTNSPRRKSSTTSSRKSKPSASPSSPNCTVVRDVCQAVCLVVCPVVCPVAQVLPAVLDPQSKRSTKLLFV